MNRTLPLVFGIGLVVASCLRDAPRGVSATSETQRVAADQEIGFAVPMTGSWLGQANEERASQGNQPPRSVAALRRLLEAQPGNLALRFELAVAFASDQQWEAASQELLALLRVDLPRFRTTVEMDSKLSTFRGSAHWAAFQRAFGELEQRWQRAAKGGLPVLALPTTERVWVSVFENVPYARAGLYLKEERRFVPLGQPLAGALGLTLSGDPLQVVGISGEGSSDPETNLMWFWGHRSDAFGLRASERVEQSCIAGCNWSLGSAQPVFREGVDGGAALLVTATTSTFVSSVAGEAVQAALQQLPEATRLLYTPSWDVLLGSVTLPRGVVVHAVHTHCDHRGEPAWPSHHVHYIGADGTVRTLSDGSKPGGGAVRLAGEVLMLQTGEETLLLDANEPRLEHATRLPDPLYLAIPSTRCHNMHGIPM